MRPTSSRLAISIAAAMVAISLSVPLHAQDHTQDFNVQRQDASSGIREFAQQAGIQVIVSGDDAQDRIVNGVSGALPPRAALDQLIAGTGLAVRSFDNNVVILEPAEPTETQGPRDTPETVEDEISTFSNVVVTGSRIARPELQFSMPVSAITMQDAASFGRTSAYDALQLLPTVAPGIGPANASDPLGGGGTDQGISTVSLRNMGTNRSLTLIDGMRRVSSSATSSAVDLNMIPPAMIERIEVVTGGAAAVYGADAVTGAVNIITKDRMDGVNFSFTRGISGEGDAGRTVFSVATGGQLGERGSFIAGGTYSKIDPFRSGDRDFSRGRILFQANPENTGPEDGIPDRIMIRDFNQVFVGPAPSFWWPDAGVNYIVDVPNNVVREPTGGVQVTGGMYGFRSGGEGGQLEDKRMLQSELEALSFMGKAKYDLTDSLTYEAGLNLGRNKSMVESGVFRTDSRANTVNNYGGDVARLDSPYLPSALRGFMLDNDLSELSINRSYYNFPAIESLHTYETTTLLQGIGGLLNEDRNLKWQAFYQYGRTSDDASYTNIPIASRYHAARDAVTDADGNTVCRDANASGCVPHNIFSEEPLTAEQQQYMLTTRAERRVNTQTVYGASLTGDLWSLPAGELAFALGIERRIETLDTRDDPRAATGEVAYFGLPGVHPDIKAESRVNEAYAEVVAPLLWDKPFARRLDLDAAWRHSDYNSFGGTDAWKAGFTWEPVYGLSIRGVRSRSVRAPNFGELYQPRVGNPSGSPADPCMGANYGASPTRIANCQALGIMEPLPYEQIGPTIISGGNPDLKPETSNSWTYGVVWEPDFIDGFDATVDYWKIDIDGVIATFGASNIYRLCVDLPTIDNMYCDLIERDPVTHLATQMETALVNAQQMMARGIDFTTRYRKDVGPGQLDVAFTGSRLLEYIAHTLPGVGSGDVRYHGSYNNPDFRGTLRVGYTLNDLRLGLNTRYISSTNYGVGPHITSEYYDYNDIPSRLYHDLSFGYRINDNIHLSAGVNNVLDQDPPIFPHTIYGAGGRYDTVGRWYFLNLDVNF